MALPPWLGTSATGLVEHALGSTDARSAPGTPGGGTQAPFRAQTIKDPRSSLLLPLWQPACEQLEISLQLLQAVRDPAELMVSLVRRYPTERAGDRRRCITARPLHRWLISDWQHKRRHMNLPKLSFEPVRSGLFYSLRLGGTWVAADWWLHYFELDERVTALRLEYLQDDLNTHLLPLLPASTPPFTTPPRANAKPAVIDSSPALTNDDRARIAAVNPRWRAWEQRVYSTQ